MIRLEDAEIKKLVLCWQNSRSPGDWEKIMSLTAGLIRGYPGFCHGQDEEACADFFAYIYPDLERIFEGFRQTPALFTSWLFVVLRCRYLNFLSARRKQTPVLRLQFSREGETKERDLSDRVAMESWKESIREKEDTQADRIRSALKAVVKSLSPERRLLLHLLFDDVSPADFSRTAGESEGRRLYGEYCVLRLRIGDRIRKDREALSALRNEALLLRRKRDSLALSSPERQRTESLLERKKKAVFHAEERLERHHTGLPYSWISRVTARPVQNLKHDFHVIRKTVTARLGPILEERKG